MTWKARAVTPVWPIVCVGRAVVACFQLRAGAQKWDNVANCNAALGYYWVQVSVRERLLLKRVADPIRLYEHRRKVRAHMGTKSRSGALRDHLRERLAEHYDVEIRAFSQSFVWWLEWVASANERSQLLLA